MSAQQPQRVVGPVAFESYRYWAEYREYGLPFTWLAVTQFDPGAADERSHEGGSSCRRVALFSRPDSVLSNGEIRRAERERLEACETKLLGGLAAAAVNGRWVARLCRASEHLGAIRELVFQVDEGARFDDALASWRATESGRVEVRASDGWSYFDDCIRPKPSHREWIRNAALVRSYTDAGRKAVAQPIEHLFAGEPSEIDALAERLDARAIAERRVQTRLAPDRLRVSQRLPLDVDAITRWTLRLSDAARRCHARYEGWHLREDEATDAALVESKLKRGTESPVPAPGWIKRFDEYRQRAE